MKLSNPEVNNSTNFDGEVFEASLNTSKLGTFMQNLIRNYNNAELATLREWVSNAHDSHVAAGQKRPVKITLPTKFSKNLTVEDFGIGMSYEDVRNIYAVFLTSTKDKDNTGIGGFGIGGKSALAVADQYTMVAVKDGLKNVFIFERSNVGGLAVKCVIRDEPTDQPNGVKVTVAVSNTQTFSSTEVKQVLEGWRPEELEIVGGTHGSFYENALDFDHGVVKESVFNSEEDDSTNRRSGYGWGRGYASELRVFVGPVSYDLPRSFAHTEGAPKNDSFLSFFAKFIAIKVPIGSVTVPSSREVIEDTEANNKVIVKAAKKLEREIQEYVNSLVEKLSSLEEAYKFACSYFVEATRLSVVYEGRDLNKITYNGFRAFNVSRYGGTHGNLVFHGETNTTLKAKAVDMVVHVAEEDANFADETYRKYLRETVAKLETELNDPQAKPRYRRRQRYYRDGIIVLLTTEKDPLASLTSAVYDFTELRKNTVLPKKGSGSRYTMEERVKRAGEQQIGYVAPITDRYVQLSTGLFSSHPTYTTEDPIVIIGRDYGCEVTLIMDALFDIGDRIIVADNKKNAKQITSSFPKAILLTDYLAALPKKQIIAAQESLKEYAKLQRLLGISYNDIAMIQNLVNSDKLSSDALELFELKKIRAAAVLGRVFNYYTAGVGTVLRNGLKLPETYRVETSSNPSRPFGLLHFNAELDEITEYINWAMTRYNQTNS